MPHSLISLVVVALILPTILANTTDSTVDGVTSNKTTNNDTTDIVDVFNRNTSSEIHRLLTVEENRHSESHQSRRELVSASSMIIFVLVLLLCCVSNAHSPILYYSDQPYVMVQTTVVGMKQDLKEPWPTSNPVDNPDNQTEQSNANSDRLFVFGQEKQQPPKTMDSAVNMLYAMDQPERDVNGKVS